MKEWLLLHSKPHKEDFLWSELLARQIDGYYPTVQVKPVNPRSRKWQPYFPGYLFVNVELESDQYKELPWLPGTNGWVHFGEEPATVPEPIINGIKRHVDELNARGGLGVSDKIGRGELVEIVDGPFAHYEAIFDTSISGSERVRVLLMLVKSQQMAVEMPSSMLRRKKPKWSGNIARP